MSNASSGRALFDRFESTSEIETAVFQVSCMDSLLAFTVEGANQVLSIFSSVSLRKEMQSLSLEILTGFLNGKVGRSGGGGGDGGGD